MANLVIPKDSLVLITGVNGLIASHVADQLLLSGYRVRGTVRDLAKCAWMEPTFAKRYGAGRFELMRVADLASPGVWDEAMRGVAGVVSVASSISSMMISDVEATVAEEMSWLGAMLSAAKNTPTVKTFAFTSSIWAAYTPEPNVPMTVTAQTWNDKAVALAADASLSRQEKGIAPVMAVKVKVEQGCWEWLKREKPAFAFNTLLLDTVLGPILDAKNQPGSTAGMVKWLWDGENLGILRNIKPQWFIDARDSALLYVAALTTPGVDGERLFGCGERYSWPKLLEILKNLYPDRKFVELEDAGWDHADMPTERPLELLRGLGREKWTSLEQSVKDNVESFLAA